MNNGNVFFGHIISALCWSVDTDCTAEMRGGEEECKVFYFSTLMWTEIFTKMFISDQRHLLAK